MRFARFVHKAGLPVLPPADAISDRPIETMSGPVTFWPLVESTGDDVDWRWLGRTLKRMHELRPPAGMSSLWNPVGVVEARLESYGLSPSASPETMRILSGLCAWARRIVGSASLADPVGLIHGDPTNVITSADGPVLIDFDLSGPGPPLWDLVSVAIRHRRFGLSLERLEECYDSYGFDPRGHFSFGDLLRLRELLDCSFALTASDGTDAGADRELGLRLRAFEHPEDRNRWTPVAASPHSR
jgi:Ser/Thr protein kinase RdoA (MazF antagonist)